MLAVSTLKKYAKSDLLERYEGKPIFFHSASCGGYCDYACNGNGERIAKDIEELETKLKNPCGNSKCSKCGPTSGKCHSHVWGHDNGDNQPLKCGQFKRRKG